MENRLAPDVLAVAKELQSSGNLDQAIREVEDVLPHLDNPRLLSEAQLMLAKCYKGQGDSKAAIAACNAAITSYSKWKEPYLLRSACFQALYTSFLDTDGDSDQNINQDRQEADIIVDPSRDSSHTAADLEKDKMRQLFRRSEKRQLYVRSIDEALRLVHDGGKIFVERGIYEVSSRASKDLASYFVFGKSIWLVGASTSACILLYRCGDDGREEGENSRPETFLIASSSTQPTIIKRFTFRNQNAPPLETKFLGVAGGTVQIEDCIFDGVARPDVDAVYTNSKICGNFASNYPSPYLIARFCIFDHCQAFGGVTSLHSCANIKSCLFTGCGSTAVAAMSLSKVTLEHCEFSLTATTETAISAASSDVSVSGCYMSGIESCGSSGVSCCAVAATEGSVARLSNNYFYRVGTGVCLVGSDLICTDNMFYSCSQRYLTRAVPTLATGSSSSSGLYAAISIRNKAKVQITGNLAKYCDIGVAISGQAAPTLRQNVFDSAFFAGVFAEGGAKPIIAENTFSGGDVNSQIPRGVGILFILNSGGMVGKNTFEDFCVSPLLVFTNCHPLLRENRFESVSIVESKQAQVEAAIITQFQTQVEVDSLFYIVDSESKEKALADVILKGHKIADQKKEETLHG